MRRRTFLKTAGSATLAASLAARSYGAGRSAGPNILFIMTDQQFADAMSCRIGTNYLRTPGMDSLAAGGTLFDRAYCANPICIPSRTSLFTGRYPHETGFQANQKGTIDPVKFPFMGSIFQQAGYDTGYVGKWHLPVSRKDPSLHGFDFMEKNKGNGVDNDIGKSVIEFMRKPRSGPFLLVASFVNPHNICEWARGQRLPDGPIGEPPPVNECPPLAPNHQPPENETDVMSLMRRSYQASPTFPVSGFDDKKWREYIWAYYRMIEMVDAHILKILEALRDSGQEEETLVVFTSDHGDCHGAHRWNQKTVFYDEASRVPLIVRPPGAAKPGTSDRLVHTGADLIPTLCDYAGIDVPDRLPGMSLKQTAAGHDEEDPREYLVISNKMMQGAPIGGVTPAPSGRMVRSKRYKYFIYDQGHQRESLVDMEKDPGEMVNLAQDDRFAEILQKHRRYLRTWCRDTKDPFGSPG